MGVHNVRLSHVAVGLHPTRQPSCATTAVTFARRISGHSEEMIQHAHRLYVIFLAC